MNDNTLLYVCIGGVVVAAIVIVVLANWLSARANQKRADRMMRDKANGTYDPKKKYMGKQGGWEPTGDGAPGGTDWNDYNRH